MQTTMARVTHNLAPEIYSDIGRSRANEGKSSTVGTVGAANEIAKVHSADSRNASSSAITTPLSQETPVSTGASHIEQICARK